ncbi:transketolase [Sulfitobacter mediterraneus]|uniref:transketolase n=1 Tax=Sulfitobacter mediterraneus TaxID=83219 RepID=UPI0019342DA4|nr:transketolase [Sulfitobacter mediterraneus]MBM1309744.1 transketolase [Sulfitobacter mediterraneus]MBM1313629.1 transketolase [Sulfitobacter mediterraneus]MBM1322013.1 transketolase [Sulfitobacter mediterraneus]MBM1325900.1 transketolase [Sulfitobacter mediterraneus]MBM1397246.1 transketolase [Sulfitobacter mediterraneus]
MDLNALRTANPDHWSKATAIRALTLDAVAEANSGHSGMPMGMADVATVLFEKHLKFDAANPTWPDRDRFILSAGHGSMLVYSLLHLVGDVQFPIEEIKNFRQMGARTAGHPENFLADAIETTTGPLGQGIANSVGFAMAEEIQRARYGKKVVDHFTYVIAGDGCLMEGVSQEAITLAGRHKLSKLIVMWDNNNITIDGPVSLSDSTDQVARFKAAGWHTIEIDGHNPDEIDAALTEARKSDLPSMIACKTHIALGHAAQDTSKGHGALTDPAQMAAAKEAYGWTTGPFEVPADVKSAWEEIGKRGAEDRAAWEARFETLPRAKRENFTRALAFDAPKKLSATVKAFKKQMSESAPKLATRASSEKVLEVLNPILPETVGGSADLTGSNNTKTADLGVFDVDNRGGRYVYWGIREHGMAAAMNGMALHGGVRPYGGTFMCFTDYARPSMRLAALMKVPTVFVMTHDSIGLGEDGPTHQPVEHLAISRATPNTYVFRPADTVETAEAWEIALTSKETPSVLSLTRQGLPTVRTEHKNNNLTSKGAYVLADAEGKRQVILIASGSEVSVAMAARDILQAEGIGVRVVSMPCMELFAEQDEAYRKRVLPGGAVRVGVEAGVRQGWDQWLLGERGKFGKADFVGMDRFGASAPAEELFEKFGITAANVAEKAKALL